MVFDSEGHDAGFTAHQRQQVDAICRAFEISWNSSSRISVEHLLVQHADLPRDLLLRELLFREIVLLNNAGHSCSLSQYLSRFPQDERVLRAIFGTGDSPALGQWIANANTLTADGSFAVSQEPTTGALVPKTVLEIEQGYEEGTVLARKVLVPPNPLRDGRCPDFPGYHVTKVIGQGGMGVVYLGMDVESNRWVALKTLRTDILLNPTAVKRFHNEVNAYRKLNHPHIVKYLTDFEHQGYPVLVLEYARGGSLASILKKGVTLPPDVAALMIEQLASAVAVAHENQLLHRDITPSNILFDFPETCEVDISETHNIIEELDREILQDSFDWRRIVPKLTDFGLLLSLEESEDTISKLTVYGQVMGTPSYMSPEGISPKFGKPSYQTDVYGLGACLYAAMTGKPPHIGFNIVDTLHRVVSDDVVPPRLVGRHIPSELSEICVRCLARNRRDRFASAVELHSDLVRFRRGHRLRYARPPGMLGRCFQWSRKNPAISLFKVSILCVGLILTFMLYSSNRRTVIQNSQSALKAVAREELGVIRESLESQFDLVKAVGIYASEHDDFSEEQFQEFCGPLVQTHRSIKALSWAAFVPQEMRKKFEENARSAGREQHFIYERSSQGELVSASDRSSYVPVQFIVPWETNRQAVGFDLGSEKRRLSALRRAEQQSDLAITSPLQLVQDEEPVEAFLAVFPVWYRTSSESSPAPVNALVSSSRSRPSGELTDTHRSLKGFASGVFHTRDVIEPCLKIAGSRLWLRILDVTEERAVVYTMPELRKYTSSNAPLPLAFSESMENFGRTWEVEFFVSPHIRADNDTPGLAIIIVGCLLSVTLAGVPLLVRKLYGIVKKRARAISVG